MNEFQIVEQRNVLGQEFKIYGDFENPLFLAKFVAELIEHTSVTKMLSSLEPEEKLMGTLFTSGQMRKMWFLTEDGLYEVLMQSRKPIAKEFKREVKKILKELRLKGYYTAPTHTVVIPTDDELNLLSEFIVAMERERKIHAAAMYNYHELIDEHDQLRRKCQVVEAELNRIKASNVVVKN